MRDSAGIELVENQGAVWRDGEEWTLGSEPLVRIGAIDGDDAETFSSIAGVFRDAEGRFVVLDARSAELRFFGSDGAHLFTRGGVGEGPGELPVVMPRPRRVFLRATALLQWSGDSIAVHGRPGAALHIFDSEGNEGRRLRSRALQQWTLNFPGESHIALETSTGDPDGPDRDGWQTSHFVSIDPDGVVDTLGLFPMHPAGEWRTYQPFGHQMAVSNGFVALRNDLPELRYYRWDGTLWRIARLPWQAIPVPDSLIAESTRPTVEFLPLFGDKLVDRQGNLWFADRTADPVNGPQHLRVVSAQGLYLGEVIIPARFSPADIGSDYVVGVEVDEFDVQYVVGYPLRKR